jgi:protein-tyrosine-phosphatase
MFEKRAPNYVAIGAGTLVLEGHPMSQRTRKALERFEISDPTHRSSQFGEKHTGVDLVVAMEPSHIAWIRRNFPEVAPRSATLPRLVRDLSEEGPLVERIMKLNLAEVEIESWEEVLDPASGDQEIFDVCAAEIDQLINELIDRLP